MVEPEPIAEWFKEIERRLRQNAYDWQMRALKAEQQVAMLTQQVEACVGHDVAADPTKWSHSAQIDILCAHLEDARAQIATLTNSNAILDQAYAGTAKEMLRLEAKVATLTEALRDMLKTWRRLSGHYDDIPASCFQQCSDELEAALAAVRWGPVSPETLTLCACTVVTGGHRALNANCPVHGAAVRGETR